MDAGFCVAVVGGGRIFIVLEPKPRGFRGTCALKTWNDVTVTGYSILVVVVMGGVGAGTLVEDGGRVSVESRLGHVRDVGDTLDEHNNGRRGMT